jgi:hypothetical protein
VQVPDGKTHVKDGTMLGDRGYDATAIRRGLRRGIS